MQKIAELSSGTLAETFINYMSHKGIDVKLIKSNNGSYELWCSDENRADQVYQELKQFLENPNAGRYQEFYWKVGKKLPRSGAMYRFEWRRFIRPEGVVTTTITIASIVIFVLSFLFDISSWIGFPANSEQVSQLWRWVTPIFLHFSLLHILFNLVWWWYLGGMIERFVGKGKIIELLLISGIVSNFAQSVASGPNFGGLSGVVYALMGYTWLMGEKAPEKGMYLERPVMLISIVWLFAGFSGVLGPIGNIAHLLGLIIGLALASIDLTFRRR